MMNQALMITTALFFSCVPQTALSNISNRGLDEGTAVYPLLETAARVCPKRIVVFSDPDVASPVDDAEPMRLSHAVSPDVILNLNPYRPPVPVEAAGGIIVRPGSNMREVVLIYRRGVWDLPKGKRDGGESLEACACREVREELGIDTVQLDRPLGQTIHGYVDGKHFAVKTTHWFLMSTAAESFAPQGAEGIERAEWVPWGVALEKLGYEILRRHLRVAGEIIGAG
jgi:8-oxo-dGTP pyrophosphatase MutT (NUDIX family)